MVETPTAKRIHSEPDRLWRIVTDYPDIFDSLIVPKLNGNDVKFFYDVNTESRKAIKRASGRLCSTFKICDFRVCIQKVYTNPKLLLDSLFATFTRQRERERERETYIANANAPAKT